MKITARDAVKALGYLDQIIYVIDTGEIKWKDGHETTEEEAITINAKIAELQAEEPMRLLREERDRRITETDWRDLPSYPGTDQNDWRTYRQALRDLPSIAEPQLDEEGNLTNVTWPTKPE